MDILNPSDFTILMVDDTPKNLQLLGSTLKNENYKLEFATNGIKALEWLKKKKFDLILLDIMMPEMTGYEVCKEIRADKQYEDTAIIFLTAKTDRESILKGFELGAQDYVTKPFDTKELLARVKTQLELKYSKEKLKSVNQWLEEEVKNRTAELDEANIQLDLANKALINLDKAKSEFLRMISHELRTPLNGILGPLHLLKDKIESEDLIKLINILDSSVARLEHYSMVALKITELKSGTYVIEKEKTNINELIEFCLIELANKIKENKITINTHFNPNLFIYGNNELILTLLKTLLDSLIENYYNEGEIEIKLNENAEYYQLVLINKNIKISEEKFSHLYRLSDDYSDITQHTSLEVLLANIILELHDGYMLTEKLSDGFTVKLHFKK